MFKIIHNKDRCIGCGKCARISKNWRIGRCNKAEPRKTIIRSLGKNEIVSMLCPVKCIKIEEI